MSAGSRSPRRRNRTQCEVHHSAASALALASLSLLPRERKERALRRKWSPASKLLAALSVVCGLGAFALVHGYAARLEALRPEIGSEVPVVVASRDIARGTQLDGSMLTVERMPSKFAPPGAEATLASVTGRTLAADVIAGEAVTAARVGAEGAGAVAALVPPGLRAMTVEAGVRPGSIRPGDRVDVLATFGGPHPHTETVATGLEVLLVLGSDGSNGGIVSVSSGSSPGGPSLVLLVSPDAAEQLAYAKAFADLSIAIDGPSP